MSEILKDEVAIITGAGRGIGRAYALRFAEEGAKLLLPDISLERSEAVAKEIRDNGGKAVAIETDISDESATKIMAEKVMQLYGRVDILLNNAAMFSGLERKPWDTRTVEEWDQMFAVNVRGTWLCCKAIASLMVKQSKGKIINISSDIIKQPNAHFLMHYSCSKVAVHAITQCLARALGPSNISVNSIAPGLTMTEATAHTPDKVFEDISATQCIPQREQPADLVGTAVFLASKDSDFVTGQILIVDGGFWLP
ncbi:SDR family NAD(P)-dependent oxidoreductase [Thermodesulfobacteriota bacterium]